MARAAPNTSKSMDHNPNSKPNEARKRLSSLELLEPDQHREDMDMRREQDQSKRKLKQSVKGLCF